MLKKIFFSKILVFFLFFFIFLNGFLKQFYSVGVSYLDAGLIADLLSHSSSWPIAFPGQPFGSFFSTHFAPFFFLTSWCFKFFSLLNIPLSSVVYFCIFMSFVNAMLIFCVAWIVFFITGRHVFFVLSSILTLLCGPVLACFAYPHWEIGIIAVLAGYFVLDLKSKKSTSLFVLCCGLFLREDAGLHYFGFFFLLALVLKIKKHAYHFYYYMTLALCCGLYSIFVLWIQRTFYPGDNALARIYFGEPAFFHVTGDFLKQRAWWMFIRARGVIFTFLSVFFFAIKRKDLFLAVGPFSVLPWVILSFFAINPTAGTLQLYYSFPVLIAFFWPIFLTGLRKKSKVFGPLYECAFRDALFVLGIACLLTLTNKAHIRALGDMLNPSWLVKGLNVTLKIKYL